jgi:hypothetical protein
LIEEHATLARFDIEIHELDLAVQSQELAANEHELSMRNTERGLLPLAKDKGTAVCIVVILQKTYEWIAEEKQYVYYLDVLDEVC